MPKKSCHPDDLKNESLRTVPDTHEFETVLLCVGFGVAAWPAPEGEVFAVGEGVFGDGLCCRRDVDPAQVCAASECGGVYLLYAFRKAYDLCGGAGKCFFAYEGQIGRAHV